MGEIMKQKLKIGRNEQNTIIWNVVNTEGVLLYPECGLCRRNIAQEEFYRMEHLNENMESKTATFICKTCVVEVSNATGWK